MKLFKSILFALLFIVFYPGPDSVAQQLNENLQILKPFLKDSWTGKLKALDGSGELEVLRNYRVILDGNAIKITKANKELNNYGEGCFYWNDIKKKISYFFIENKGVFCEGFVDINENIITITGTMTWPAQMNPNVKQSFDFRNTFEFTEDGKMIDKWFQNAFGEWRPGHVIVFE